MCCSIVASGENTLIFCEDTFIPQWPDSQEQNYNHKTKTFWLIKRYFDAYQKILQEAIEELKENEFKELYPTEESGEKEYVKEVQIDTDFEILFPDDYVNSVSERLVLYNKLSEVSNEEELQVFESEIIDRFGEYPTQVSDLLDSVRIKWLAKSLGFS